jgi:hypothetical protein
MQTTGEINMIQVSSVTANLLAEANKSHWIKKRDESVAMKGKGLVETFWADPLISEDDDSDDESQASGGSGDLSHMSRGWGDAKLSSESCNQRKADDKVKRLVEWNTVLLLRHLKMVAATRNLAKRRRASMTSAGRQQRRSSITSVGSQRRSSIASGGSQQRRCSISSISVCSEQRRPSNETQVSSLYSALSSLATPLEDVSEIITMPAFSEKVAKDEADPESIDLGDTIQAQLLEYVNTIASMYRDNPFHNFEHASHVVMSANKVVMRIIKPDLEDHESFTILNRGRASLKRKVHESTFGISSDTLMQFAVVFSALIHDVDHPGVSNAQLVKEGIDVALRYDNKCVAEQNSVDIAWNLLMQEKYHDLLQCICPTEEEQRRFRQLLVNAVIATDIADKELQQKRKTRWDKAFQSNSEASLEFLDNDKNDLDRKATIVFEYIIQASDVAHTMQHWKVYKKWNERLFEERYFSFVTGREEHDPSIGWYQGELWFFDNYIIPLAKKLETCGVFGVSSDEYLSYALENRHEWETKGEEIVQNMVRKFNSLEDDHQFCDEESMMVEP